MKTIVREPLLRFSSRHRLGRDRPCRRDCTAEASAMGRGADGVERSLCRIAGSALGVSA